MALAKINSDEETILEFDIQVFGTDAGVSDVRFVIQGKEFDIICHCSESEDSGVRVRVPRLKGIFEPGDYDVRLDAIVNDRIFTPLKDSIEILPLVELKVKKKTVKPVVETVKVKTANVQTPRAVATFSGNSLKEALDAGATTEESNGATFLKVRNKYAGIVVNENKILMADSPMDTIEQLVEAIEKAI